MFKHHQRPEGVGLEGKESFVVVDLGRRFLWEKQTGKDKA